MNYYVKGYCGHTLVLKLDVQPETRAHFAPTLTIGCPEHGDYFYSNRDIIAVPSTGQAFGGVLAGALVGILGPIFLVGGILVGAMVGSSMQQSEQQRADRFNNS